LGKKDTLNQFCNALKKYDRYLLSCHVAPEGDAIGSLLAMESLLRRLGKKTTVVCEDEFPKRLSCLSDKRWHTLNQIEKSSPSFEALVVTDCPTLERIGNVRKLLFPPTVIFNIDHHVSNTRFGDHNYIHPEAAACGEVVFDIFKHFRIPLTKEDAKNLYVAISTDTGSFKYSNTTVRSHHIAAELIHSGIDTEKINDELYSTYSLNRIQLYSRLLGKVKTAANGAIAWVVMTHQDLVDSGSTYEDTEGFIDFLKYLKEVKIAFFMGEVAQRNEVRVSFRSKGSFDVNKIATHFHGGGHKKAAGCTLHATLKEAEKMILDQIRKTIPF
jgi:phosphoesterase RecJ-like protein